MVTNKTLDAFQGVKFLIVQPINEKNSPTGKPIIACDSIGANTGETVFMTQGREATFPLPDKFNPSDMTITAIIDEITTDE